MYGKNNRTQGTLYDAQPVPWKDRNFSSKRQGLNARNERRDKTWRLRGIMCHLCYIPEDNYATESKMNLRNKIITNFEALTEADRKTVPR